MCVGIHQTIHQTKSFYVQILTIYMFVLLMLLLLLSINSVVVILAILIRGCAIMSVRSLPFK